MNPRPMGYEPIELPGCSTPRQDSRSADVVGAEGLEPSRPLRTADFKSDVSTNSTTRPSRAPAPPSQVAVAYKRLSHGRWVVKTEATLPALTPEDTACRPCSRTRASVRAVRGPACRLVADPGDCSDEASGQAWLGPLQRGDMPAWLGRHARLFPRRPRERWRPRAAQPAARGSAVRRLWPAHHLRIALARSRRILGDGGRARMRT